ncbi:hypothetical protein ACGFYQ_34050 [Streptomyces sp. NPDC048258]|uniref:hypothetical protein n=1 Tax=Streptomyces sp. NPDC048258 TaxID=3365527 RepID=UPI00371E7757
MNRDPITRGVTLPQGAIEAGYLAPGAVETVNVSEDIRREEPYIVEQIILHALAEFSLGGPPMGKDEARRWLSLYLHQVAEGHSPVDLGVQA